MVAGPQGFPVNPNLRPPINQGQFNRGATGPRPAFISGPIRQFPNDRSGQQQFIGQRFQSQLQALQGQGQGLHIPLSQAGNNMAVQQTIASQGQQSRGQFQQAMPIQGQTQNIMVEAIPGQPSSSPDVIPRPSGMPQSQNGGNFPGIQAQGSNQNQRFFGNGRRKRHTDPDCQRLKDDPDTYCRIYETQCHNCTLEKRLRFEGTVTLTALYQIL